MKRAIKNIYDNWTKSEKYIIFGDYFLIKRYLSRENIEFIVDNNEQKWGKDSSLGIEVKSPEHIKDCKCKIIIANQWTSSIKQIANQLNILGYKENIDYILYKKLLTIWHWKYEGKVTLSYTEYMVTTKCSLKCKNCILFIPLYKYPKNVTINEFKEDIDSYFKKVDRVLTFRILGGEPFLNNDLSKIILFLCEKYRDKIYNLELVTNGTIIPKNDEVFELCKKYNIKIHISNYTNMVDYEIKLKKLLGKLKIYGIEIENAMPDKWSWKLIQSPEISNNKSKKFLQKLFEDCQTHCRALKNKKLYYCAMQSSAVNANLFLGDSDDYIDLGNDVKKEDIIKFELGFLKKRYVSFCQSCLGIGNMNNNYVIPGEQYKNKS